LRLFVDGDRGNVDAAPKPKPKAVRQKSSTAAAATTTPAAAVAERAGNKVATVC